MFLAELTDVIPVVSGQRLDQDMELRRVKTARLTPRIRTLYQEQPVIFKRTQLGAPTATVTMLKLAVFILSVLSIVVADEGYVPANSLPSQCGFRTSNLRAVGDFLSDSSYKSADWDVAGPAILQAQPSFGNQCLLSINITGLVPGKGYGWKASDLILRMLLMKNQVASRGDWNLPNWGCTTAGTITTSANNCGFVADANGNVTLNIETRGPVKTWAPYSGTPVNLGGRSFDQIEM